MDAAFDASTRAQAPDRTIRAYVDAVEELEDKPQDERRVQRELAQMHAENRDALMTGKRPPHPELLPKRRPATGDESDLVGAIL